MQRLRAWVGGWRGVGLLALVVALLWLAGGQLPDGRLHVYFLDVGQGDAIFVRSPDGHQILIDGGPSPTAVLSELGQVMPFWDRSLDLVVLTHPDQDHLAGLLAVVDRFSVAQALDTDAAESEAAGASWREALAERRVRHQVAQDAARLVVGDVTLTVLRPGAGVRPAAAPAGDNNNRSLVLRLDYGQSSWLLTGDAEQEEETALLAAGLPLQADVLKVGHHGSQRSTSAAFVAAVAPRLAVIQVGRDNRFGHPHPAVLNRLAGMPVLSTDLRGRIETISDGRRLWAQTAR